MLWQQFIVTIMVMVGQQMAKMTIFRGIHMPAGQPARRYGKTWQSISQQNIDNFPNLSLENNEKHTSLFVCPGQDIDHIQAKITNHQPASQAVSRPAMAVNIYKKLADLLK